MLTKDKNSNISILSRKYDIVSDAKQVVSQTDNSVLIINVCNNMNTFGAGFNKTIAEAFPLAKENYHMLGPTKIRTALGHTQFVTVSKNNKFRNEIIVANMICQTGIISQTNPRPLNYFFLGSCLYKVQHYLKQYRLENDLTIQTYSPKFNAGISGCSWNIVKELILDTLKKPTFTNIYESHS